VLVQTLVYACITSLIIGVIDKVPRYYAWLQLGSDWFFFLDTDDCIPLPFITAKVPTTPHMMYVRVGGDNFNLFDYITCLKQHIICTY